MCPTVYKKSNGVTSHIGPYLRTNHPANVETSSYSSASKLSEEDEPIEDLFSVNLTPTFVIHTLILVAAISFSVGTSCRIILLNSLINTHHMSTNFEDRGMSLMKPIQLPSPTVPYGKDVPLTTFTSKTFLQTAAATSNTVHLDRHSFSGGQESEYVEQYLINDDDEDEIHLPAGQHLLVDIKHVDSDFLNSEERLALAMVDLIEESKLTLLSYHCHSLVVSGVSCVGVLLESHISLHSFPQEGTIIMDLFTCGAEPLIPILPTIKKLFGIPSHGEVGVTDEAQAEPSMLWSHKLRGFRQGFSTSYKSYENPLDHDLGSFLNMNDFGMKVPLASEETDFQHVDVLEVINTRVHSMASYERSLSNDGSYESLHQDLYKPDKILFLDGVQQSSLRGEAAYHEALVHPSMITHPNPKRVAIVGGGEGATLREVLKHKTVEHVTMVEIDEDLVEICNEFLPEWSDCADNAGSGAHSCFDDSRASIEFEDAFKWFIDRFEEGETTTEEKFDVIIMDALDPDKLVEIVGNLYKDNMFIDSLANALTEEGVFVVQLGQSESIHDPPDEMGPGKDTANMMEALQNIFENLHEYDEGHSHFYAPWTYLVCLKNSQSRANWYKNAAEIEIELHQRLYGTESGEPPLLFFDGPTMISYQVPSKAKETMHCRKEAEPWECHEYLGLNPELVNIPISHLEARKSTVGEYAGRGLFASQDISMGSNLDVNGSVKAFHVMPSTWSVIEGLYGEDDDDGCVFQNDELSSVLTFVQGYGYGATLLGKRHYSVDSTIMNFCNHGCNGTYNYRDNDNDFTEMNVDLDHAPEALLNKATIYSPVFERHLRQISAVGGYTTRDIRQGEEILCDYLAFDADPNEWKEEMTSLRGQCTGETMGQVTEYELDP